MKCECETKFNNIITSNIIPISETLISDTYNLSEKYRNLNFEIKELMMLEQQLKMKEVQIDNKRVEIQTLEKKSHM